MSFLKKIFPDFNTKFLRKTEPLIAEINALEKSVEKFSDEAIRERIGEIKRALKEGVKKEEDVLTEVFALTREAAKRTLGQRHFDVQLAAGIVLHRGMIAEMKTGEGKTLAATLAASLNALRGKGVHIVTVNDYLAKRDTVWMGQIYNLLGISVGCITHNASYLYSEQTNVQENESAVEESRDKERDAVGGFKVVENFLQPCSRQEAYCADITYGTNNEFGFDFLRDNLVFNLEDKVQREFSFAIVDEIDSILIDEARTPLIVSAPDEESSKWYKDFSRIAPRLKKDLHYEVDEKLKVVVLTEKGIEEVEKFLGVDNIYEEKGIRYIHHLEQALRAEVFFKKDRDYIVKDGEVIIVDEFTGRLMPGRRWSGGLHQAVEAKEGVQVKPESRILASVTFQNYFRMYKKLSGMTGTAATSAEEFRKVYGLEVIVVPTNKPMIREDLPDKVYKTEKGKFTAIINEVKRRHQRGQPVLVGTSSIEKNEILARMLDREGVRCEVLNAKNHQREGEIIAQAGRKGAVTVATNMAGRGVDIILGGNPPDSKEAEEVKSLGGLHVIGAQRHESRRIDDQLRGRSGRQGDPGSSQFFISLEDDILRIFGGERIKKLMSFLNIPEDCPIEAKMLSGAIEKAQARVEGMNFDARSHVLQYDDVIAKHRNKIYFLRNELLKGDNQALKKYLLSLFKEEIAEMFSAYWDSDKEKVLEELKTIIPLSPEAQNRILNLKDAAEAEKFINTLLKEFLNKKEKEEEGDNFKKLVKFVCLNTLDSLWSEHLEVMDALKDSVNLRAYGGRDPLVEYKTEGHKLFQRLQAAFRSQVTRTLFKLSLSLQAR